MILLLFILITYSTAVNISYSESNAERSIFESIATEMFDGTWQNLTGAGCENNSNKVYTTVYALTHSEILQISSFNFSLPENIIINGIIVSFNVQINKPGVLSDFRESDIGLIKNRQGIEKYRTLIANESEFPPWDKTSSIITYPLQGQDLLWGTNWTPSEINSNGFGVFIRTKCGSTDTIGTINCVNVSITYEIDPNYTLPSKNDPLLKMPYILAISLGGGAMICIAYLIIIFIYIAIKRKKNGRLRLIKRQMIEQLEIQNMGTELNEEQSPYLKNIVLYKPIARGTYGEIWLATYQYVDTKIICKCSANEEESSFQNIQIKKEIAIHKTISHPNIIQYLGICVGKREFCISYQEFLVMEFAELGSAKNYLKKNTSLGWNKILSMCIQISGAMNYLHGESILHRDISARNILLKRDLSAKLCDFGMAIRLDTGQKIFKDSSTIEIPLRWSAPETLKEREYSKMSDVWSFGVTIWELFMYGKDPWPLDKVEVAVKNITNGTILQLKNHAVSEMDALLIRIFEFNPLNRLEFSAINSILYEIQDTFFGKQIKAEVEQFYSIDLDEKVEYNNINIISKDE
jgi:tRNA A-37 threonylcarbamoyl transferase component Bud32